VAEGALSTIVRPCRSRTSRSAVGIGASASIWASSCAQALSQGVLVGGIAVSEFAADRGGVGTAFELWFRDCANFADLARDCGGDGNFWPIHEGTSPAGSSMGLTLTRASLVVDLGDPPHLAALDEHLPGWAKLTTKRSSKVPIWLPRGDVVDLVGLLVRDHREIGVDVLPGAAGGLDAILGLVEPENSIPVEFGNDLADRLRWDGPEGVRPRDRLDGVVDVRVAAALDDRRQLICDHVQAPLVDRRWLDLAVAGPASDRKRLERVVGPRRDDRAIRDLVLSVARATDPLEEAGDLSGTLVLDHVIDLPHVDPEPIEDVQREAVDPAGLEPVLDVDPGLPSRASRGGRRSGGRVPLNREPSASAVWRVLTKMSVDSWSSTRSRISRT